MADSLDLGNLLVHLRMDTRQYFASLKLAEARMKALSVKMAAIGRQLTLRVSLPLAAVGVAAVKAFANFDDAMTKSLAIMNGVTPVIRKEMELLAITMSNQTVTGATDLAKGYFFLASAGLNAQQSIAALNTVNQFAIAGNFDMAKATDLATDAQSALGLTVKDAQKNMENMARVTDTLVGANTLANATVEQFSLALTSGAGPAMKAFGIELEEGVAVLAAYADQGIKAQEAGNLLSRMLRLMTKGFKDNRGAWNQFKIDIFDATGELKPLNKIIGDLSDTLAVMSTEQKIATLDLLGFQARSQQAILPLLGLQNRIESYNIALKDMGEITRKIAEENMKSFTSQIIIFKNQVVNMGRDIGRIIAPAILKMNEQLKVAVKAWGDLSEQTKKNVIMLAGFIVIIPPIIVGLAAMLKLLAAIGLAAILVSGSLLIIAAVIADVFGNKSRLAKRFLDEFSFMKEVMVNFVVNAQKAWAFITFGFKQMLSNMKSGWETTLDAMKVGLAALLVGFSAVPGGTNLRSAANTLLRSRSGGAQNNQKANLEEFGRQIKLLDDARAKIFEDIEFKKLGGSNDNSSIMKIGEQMKKLQAELLKAKDSVDFMGEAFRKAQEKADQWRRTVEEFRAPLAEWSVQAAEVATRVGEAFASAFDRMGSELADFLVDGKANFNDFAKSVMKDLLAILIRAQIIIPIAQGLGILSGGVGGGTTPTSSTNLGPGGGNVGGLSGILPMAEGGLVRSPTLAMIGEGGGPEAVIPLNGGAIPVNFTGGGGAPTIVINNNTGQPFKQDGAPDFDGKNFIISIVAEDINQNGTLRGIIGGINNFNA